MDGSLLAGWENFYVIVGSCAGGLTGLTFVVIALIRDVQRPSGTGLRAFLTPTIVHFGGVLALAAYLSMPPQGVMSLSVGFAVAGLVGRRDAALSHRNCGLAAAARQSSPPAGGCAPPPVRRNAGRLH